VDKALALGYETWAGIRKNSSRTYLQNKHIRFIDLDYGNKTNLKEQLRHIVNETGRFDSIVHIAGLTKAVQQADFDKVNYEYTRHLVDALIEIDAVPDSFIFMSTLGVMGVGDEIHYTPFAPHHTPNPNTTYGKSKLKAENYLKNLPDFPYVILRPTGVYGARDKDYLILMRVIQKGFEISIGFRKQLLTFIHIDDLVKIIFSCIDKKIDRKEYNVADGDIYTDSEFNTIVQQALQQKRAIRLKIPLWIVRIAASVNEKIAGILGKSTTFNTDKYRIMKQRNWSCDISPVQADLDFQPDFRLKAGIEKTIKWYKEQNWL
jgi:nucleoside-diphosphate-sugar epimerase